MQTAGPADGSKIRGGPAVPSSNRSSLEGEMKLLYLPKIGWLANGPLAQPWHPQFRRP